MKLPTNMCFISDLACVFDGGETYRMTQGGRPGMERPKKLQGVGSPAPSSGRKGLADGPKAAV